MMDVSKMNGVKVITANSYTLGEVEGANIDTKSWKMTHVKVELSDEATRELGYSKVCLPVESIAGYGDVMTLNKSLMELKGLNECKIKR
jgi:sporulation protein YlmC with PRC-barrel domain